MDILKRTIKNKNIHFIKGETNPENFIGKIKKINPNKIYFLDAVFFEGKIGDVKTFNLDQASDMSIPTTHYMSIKVFKRLFPYTGMILVGIKPKNLEYGEEISTEIKNKFNLIVERIKKIIES